MDGCGYTEGGDACEIREGRIGKDGLPWWIAVDRGEAAKGVRGNGRGLTSRNMAGQEKDRVGTGKLGNIGVMRPVSVGGQKRDV